MDVKNLSYLLFAAAIPVLAGSNNAYIQHNLVADTPGAADVTDPSLVNPWGIAESATGPFWISDAGTGLATVYSTSATATITTLSLKVSVPAGAGATMPSPDPNPNPNPDPNPYPYPYSYVVSRNATTGTQGVVTGQLANTGTGFAGAKFIFCTQDGTISTWSSGTAATIAVDNSGSGAIYKGMALGGTASAPLLYVGNFHSGAVEVYDANFAPVTLGSTAFVDAQIPSGFAPFNIANLNGNLYVAYAKQVPGTPYDQAGAGNGYIDIFDMNGNLKTHLVAGGALNSPWGMVIAPANFGAFSNMLLVANFGDGKINAYDPAIGTSKGVIEDPTGAPISISGLWGLQVGNGKSGGDANAVYFTAGTGQLLHGLFGSLQAAPVLPASGAVINGASFQSGIAQYSWITIKGASLSSTTRTWASKDFSSSGALPKSLDGVSVTVDGKPAYVYYISPVQINALMPADSTLGTVQVTVTNQTLGSNSAPGTMQDTAPAFFLLSGTNYVAALHANNTVVGPTTLYPNNSTPAAPTETIELFATGFGPGTTPIPDGQLITTPVLITGVTMTIGGINAPVSYQGMVEAGVYQFNVTVPGNAPNGDQPLVANIGSQSTQTGVLVSVHN